MDIEGFESLPANPGLQSISANTYPTLDGTNTGTMHPPSPQHATPSAAGAMAYFAASPIVTLISTTKKPNQEQIMTNEQAVDNALMRIKNETQVEEESFQQHDEIDKVKREHNDAAYKAARERDDAFFNYVREHDDAREKSAGKRIKNREKMRKARISEMYEVKQSLSIARFKATMPSQDEEQQTRIFFSSTSACPEDVTSTITAAQDGCRRNLFGEEETNNTGNLSTTHLLSNAPPSPFDMHPSNYYTFSIGVWGGTDKKRQAKCRIKLKTHTPIKSLRKHQSGFMSQIWCWIKNVQLI
jgi:hypothetical protein